MSLRIVVFSVICLLGAASTALAGEARFITIDVPGASYTAVYGTNAEGDLVGEYDDADGTHAFILRNGDVETFDYPGATWTIAYGINSRGDVVGQYFAGGSIHGFVLWKGSADAMPIDIVHETTLGLPNTMPFKIGSDGTIVGCYHENGVALRSMRGFVIGPAGVSEDFDAGTMFTGVNSSGVLVGHQYVNLTPSPIVSYLDYGGTRTSFSYPGAAITRAWDINERGDVVGFYRDGSGHLHGFLYSHDEMQSFDVDLPGVVDTIPYGISATGDIVGYYRDTTYHGFVYTKRGPKQ